MSNISMKNVVMASVLAISAVTSLSANAANRVFRRQTATKSRRFICFRDQFRQDGVHSKMFGECLPGWNRNECNLVQGGFGIDQGQEVLWRFDGRWCCQSRSGGGCVPLLLAVPAPRLTLNRGKLPPRVPDLRPSDVKAGAPQAAPFFLTGNHARVCPFRATFRLARKKFPRGLFPWHADDRHRLSFGFLLAAAAADRRARCRLLGNPLFPRSAQPVLGSGTGRARDRSPSDPLFTGLSGLARCLSGRAFCGRAAPFAAGGNGTWIALAAGRDGGGGGFSGEFPPALGLPFWSTVAGLALDAAVVAAFALCIAALSTVSVLPLALGAAFAVAGKALGATMDYLARGADGDQELLASYSPIVDRIRWLVPDLSRLDWREWSMYQLAPGAETVFWSVSMAVAYIVLLMVAASLLFSRREFS
jgi:hypothetical protein